MKKTLVIEDDIADELNRLRKERNQSLKSLVNETLRLGLARMNSSPKSKKPFETNTVSSVCRIDITSIPKALAEAEGEAYK